MNILFDTREYGLKFEPNLDKSIMWNLFCYSDSDYAADPDSKRNVLGYILSIRNVPISCRSKAQRSVTSQILALSDHVCYATCQKLWSDT